MNKVAVVYTSKYGHTKQYADWLNEEVGCDLYIASERIDFARLNAYKLVIYACGVYNDKLSILDFVKKNISSVNTEQTMVMAVSWYVNDSDDAKAKLIDENYPDVFKSKVPMLVINSGIDKKKISPVDNVKLLASQIAIEKHNDRSSDDINALAIIKGYADQTSKDNLTFVIDKINEFLKPKPKKAPAPKPVARNNVSAPAQQISPIITEDNIAKKGPVIKDISDINNYILGTDNISKPNKELKPNTYNDSFESLVTDTTDAFISEDATDNSKQELNEPQNEQNNHIESINLTEHTESVSVDEKKAVETITQEKLETNHNESLFSSAISNISFKRSSDTNNTFKTSSVLPPLQHRSAETKKESSILPNFKPNKASPVNSDDTATTQQSAKSGGFTLPPLHKPLAKPMSEESVGISKHKHMDIEDSFAQLKAEFDISNNIAHNATENDNTTDKNSVQQSESNYDHDTELPSLESIKAKLSTFDDEEIANPFTIKPSANSAKTKLSFEENKEKPDIKKAEPIIQKADKKPKYYDFSKLRDELDEEINKKKAEKSKSDEAPKKGITQPDDPDEFFTRHHKNMDGNPGEMPEIRFNFRN